MEPKVFETELAGRKLQFEIGKFACLANGSVMVRYGDTAVLATASCFQGAERVGFFSVNGEL